MKIIKLLLINLAILSLTFMGCQKKTDPLEGNPFKEQSILPYGAPDFSKISYDDYMPAFEAGIEQQRAEIEAIVKSDETPTFDNVILAYEKSGKLLDRVANVFFALASADATDEIQNIEKEVIPKLTSLSNEITFNQEFFNKIKFVYDNELSSLQGEDKKLLEEIYKGFVRSGANLPDDKKAELEQVNLRIADLQQQFTTQLPEATNAAIVWVDSEEELAGLSENDIAQCKADAESRGGKAPYAIVITNTTQQPLLTYLENRALREKVFKASYHRADETSSFNTYPIIKEMMQLRAKKGELLGFPDYASYSLSDVMAKNTDNSTSFLRTLIDAYLPKAKAETEEIEQFARKTQGSDFQLQPYDRFFYSAKMKEEQFNITDSQIKPYFQIDSVLINGVFYAAERAYGITFEKRDDIPVYNDDMSVYTVKDSDGSVLALFYNDYFRHETKRGGAWMSSFAKQSHFNNQVPLIYNVCNFAKAPEGQPTLLTWDEVTTMFHEFGHALHGILSNCKYNTLSGTAVARDFVELPSQFNEYFATVDEVFDNYAKHYKTGEKMPEDLKKNMLESVQFHSAYALGENLAASSLDMLWHMLSKAEAEAMTDEDVLAFEENALEKIGLLDRQIPPRYRTTYFNHVWGGGYAAGYYSYLWAEVLSVNVGEYFDEHGPLNPEVGRAFREKILSKGNTEDLGKIFTDFTGLEQPNAASLLKARGL